jgi:hypothetical protein
LFGQVQILTSKVLVLKSLQLKFSFDSHPDVQELGSETLEHKFWVALAEAGLLLGPGTWIQQSCMRFENDSLFAIAGDMFAADSSLKSSGNIGHFRISFSYGNVRISCSCEWKRLKAIHIRTKR